MGTRSSTHIIDSNGNKILSMYRQYDGYPSGHGAELAEFINSGKFVNGISLDNDELVFNGSGGFAAALVAHLKTEPGNIYLTYSEDSQEYDYIIRFTKDGYKEVIQEIQVFNYDNKVFAGNLEAFTEFVKT